jgi:DNA modification methylase
VSDLTTEPVDLDALTPHPDNANLGRDEVVADSLDRYGQWRPLVAQRSTGRVLIGHTMLRAARRLGWQQIAVHWRDVGDDEARRILAVDNRSRDLADTDERALLALLESLDGLDGTGYAPDDLGQLHAVLEAEEQALRDSLAPRGADRDDAGSGPPPDPGLVDAAPPLPAEPETRPGDLWQLGDHRLLCGDATNREDVARLLAGERCDLMVTDPPYGVSYVGRGSEKNVIRGDLTEAAIPISFAVAVEDALTDNARLYLFGGSGNWTMYAKLFEHHTRREVKPIVWVKEQFVLRPNGYHSQFEMVYYGWKGAGGAAKHWYGDRKASDVWQVRRDSIAERVHPTQKPVEVCAIPIRYSSPPGGLVYEPFAGSGSTLIAAEIETRTCRALELDPAYCDVIAHRWAELTGKQPVRVPTEDQS